MDLRNASEVGRSAAHSHPVQHHGPGVKPPERTRNTVTCLYAARALRDFGDGFVSVLLPVYLAAIGLSAFEIGVVATLALLGSALATLAVGMLGARVDSRNLLMAASGLMIATGLAFALSDTYGLVLLVALIGTINPSSGSVSIFVPLEHAVLSRSAVDQHRTAMFARYSLIGALAAAVGSLASASVDLMATIGLSHLAALKVMFVLYGLLGAAGGVIYARLPPEPWTEEKPPAALGPSRGIVYTLAALFSIDAFAGGFAVQSLLALWLFTSLACPSLLRASSFFGLASLRPSPSRSRLGSHDASAS
jgi:MFS family permease